MKTKSAGVPLESKLVLMYILAVLAAQGVSAEVKKGIIRLVEMGGIRGVTGRCLEIKVDTTGNRIADHVLTFPDPTFGWARDLQNFAERGMEIVFDDGGFEVAPTGHKFVDGFNTISIDGVNMADLFPAEKDRFKFAAKALSDAGNGKSPPPPKTGYMAENAYNRLLVKNARPRNEIVRQNWRHGQNV